VLFVDDSEMTKFLKETVAMQSCPDSTAGKNHETYLCGL